MYYRSVGGGEVVALYVCWTEKVKEFVGREFESGNPAGKAVFEPKDEHFAARFSSDMSDEMKARCRAWMESDEIADASRDYLMVIADDQKEAIEVYVKELKGENDGDLEGLE